MGVWMLTCVALVWVLLALALLGGVTVLRYFGFDDFWAICVAAVLVGGAWFLYEMLTAVELDSPYGDDE